jgi:indolepyruvate ferredoxin oxidoreductase
VPEGSCAFGGVGCHLMATWMDRRTLTVSQMGGEGATWIGMAEHAGVAHVFANMGDGTYFHSGLLAIRAAVAAGVNITYKILYNDAVAMTGGQAVDGPLSVPRLTRQLAAEGVARIAVLADDPRKYPAADPFAPGVRPLPRERLDAVQRELRALRGVTVLIYDQVCATEARRRRKRGALMPKTRHVFINEAVCEGCGDCSAKSNCLSIVPLPTEFGVKRAIDRFTCNFDYTCLEGLCPALVTVDGAPKRGHGVPLADSADLPEPALPSLERPYALLIAGIGGTGVVTLGALLGMAAHLDGNGVTVLDQTGLAQKGGAVLTHVRVAREQPALHAPHIVRADALLASDLLVAADPETLSLLRRGQTRGVINTAETITGEFVRDPERRFPREEALAALRATLAGADELDATRLASLLAGDSIATNLFMLGWAWQRGLVPVSRDALERSIELNGVAVADNLRAFSWGRHAVHDRVAAERIAAETERVPPARRLSRSLDEAIARRRAELVGYQDERLARRYEALVERVRALERRLDPASERLTSAVAMQAFRLYAYKDEYEVARLYADPAFGAALDAAFEAGHRWRLHLAPPWRRGENARKRPFGPWMRGALRLLALGKRLRGTPFDAFGASAERRLERSLVARYEDGVERLLRRLDADRLEQAIEIAELPQRIRGFGAVKRRHAEAVLEQQERLLAAYER